MAQFSAKSHTRTTYLIRVCYAYHFPIRVPTETKPRSKHHLPHPYAYCLVPYAYQTISYAYCLVPYAYDQKPEFPDLQWLSLLRDLSKFILPQSKFHTKSLISSNTNSPLFDFTNPNIIAYNFYEFLRLKSQFRSSNISPFSAYINLIRGKTIVSYYPVHIIP